MASQALKIAALAAISTLVGLSGAQAGVTSVVCGALIKSIARTNSPGWNSSSTIFVNIPNQLKLQAAVQDPASTFNIQVWTMSVDILK